MKRQLLTITHDQIYKGVALAGLMLLGWLCQEVWQKESWPLDTNRLTNIHQWANPAFDRIMLSITSLGDPEFVLVIIALSAGWLLWQRRLPEVKILILACAGALVLNQGMKLIFTRPRQLFGHLYSTKLLLASPVVTP
jgi:membrane-associated phospholipid phosphatase